MKTSCFFGDSITCRGIWLGEIIEHVYPVGTRVYTCGVGSDNAPPPLNDSGATASPVPPILWS